jgi:hypothetical protein
MQLDDETRMKINAEIIGFIEQHFSEQWGTFCVAELELAKLDRSIHSAREVLDRETREGFSEQRRKELADLAKKVQQDSQSATTLMDNNFERKKALIQNLFAHEDFLDFINNLFLVKYPVVDSKDEMFQCFSQAIEQELYMKANAIDPIHAAAKRSANKEGDDTWAGFAADSKPNGPRNLH